MRTRSGLRLHLSESTPSPCLGHIEVHPTHRNIENRNHFAIEIMTKKYHAILKYSDNFSILYMI